MGVFVLADEALAYRLFYVMRQYALQGPAEVVMVGPLDELRVGSRKGRAHTNAEVRALARERMRALGLIRS